MQSTILFNKIRVGRVLSFAPSSIRSVTRGLRGLATFTPTGIPGDPRIHGGETEVSETMTQGIDTEHGETGDNSSNSNQTEDQKPTRINDTYVPPNAPNQSSPKLENTPVNKPIDPLFQQNRHHSNSSSTARIEDVNCAGIGLSKWPDDERDRRRQRREQEEDDRVFQAS